MAAREIHLIFDKFESPSLKDLTFKSRQEFVYAFSSSNFKISGPHQERIGSLAKCLIHHRFREELVHFLIQQWSSESPEALNGKRVFLSFGKNCYFFGENHENGKTLSLFETDHTEVESKMIFHVNKIKATDIVIKTSEPEYMLIHLLYNMQFWKEKQIWIEVGDIHKNTLEQINVNEIFDSLNSNFIKALPAWYIFTGCSFEPAFYNKGRKSCFKFFEKSSEYQIAFANFGVHDQSKRDIEIIEKYVCQLYGTSCEKVNEARAVIFQKSYTTRNGVDFTKKGWFLIVYFFLDCKFINLN